MSTNTNSRDLPPLLIFLLIAVAIFIVFVIVKIGPIVFVFLGYNCFFFLDNLFEIPVFNPIIVWGVIGLIIGSIIGVIVAIKNLKLNTTLILYPVAFILLLLIILGINNDPLYHDVKNIEKDTTAKFEKTQISYYKVKSKADVRTEPFGSGKKLFTLKRGEIVELVSTNYSESKKNNLWFKIRYNNIEGFIDSKLIEFSHY